MRTRIAFVVAIAATIIGTFAGSVAVSVAAPGPPPPPDELIVPPGSELVVGGSANSVTFHFGLKAVREQGSVIMQLVGPRLSLCTAHGSGTFIDFATESGNSPVQDMECGRAGGMDVQLRGCTAAIEYHGIVHSDRAREIYLGPMSAEVQFTKTGPDEGRMRITTYTPRNPIVLEGSVRAAGPIVMATCP